MMKSVTSRTSVKSTFGTAFFFLILLSAFGPIKESFFTRTFAELSAKVFATFEVEAMMASVSEEATPNLSFVDTQCPSVVTSTISVTDDLIITDVNVGMNATIVYRHHITATLESPSGTIVELTSVGAYSGASPSISNWDLLFDEASANALNDGDSDIVAAPNYENERIANPSGNLDDFNGENSIGTWKLHVCDYLTSTDNGGTLNSWKLEIEGDAPCSANGNPPVSTQGTCDGSLPNNDAAVSVDNIVNADRADISTAGASSYNGDDYADAETVSGGSISFTGLEHNKNYIIRIFETGGGCFTDLSFTSANSPTACPSLPNDLPWGGSSCGGANVVLQSGISAVTCGVTESVPAAERFTFAMIDIDGALPNSGRVDVSASQSVYHHASWHIDTIGNVYGTAINNRTGDVFLTASSNYGQGFFGYNAITQYGEIGGGANDVNAAGTVYKIDGVTGQASVFAQLPQQSTTFTHWDCEYGDMFVRTTGVGLGNIAYDERNNQYFVTNIEDGRIYRLNSSGAILDSYDPFTYDDGNAGISILTETAYGIAVEPGSERLFFGVIDTTLTGYVPGEGQPGIYSIDLSNGGFVGTLDNTVLPSGVPANYVGTETFHTAIPVGSTSGCTYINNSTYFISDLTITPAGDMLVGVRVGCNISFHTSYNHWGETNKVSKNGNLYNGTILEYDISHQGCGLDDSYGGVTYWELQDGSGDVHIAASSGDIIEEAGPHGIAVYSDTVATIDSILPMGVISYGTVDTGDPKGVGGDVEVYSKCSPCTTPIVSNENYNGCEGDGYSVTVNGTVYNESNQTGTEVLMSSEGCDSTINISLVFNPETSGSETYTGCSNDGYFVTVNGTIYNELNPTGTEVLNNANGCDSTVTINLIYNIGSLGEEIYTGCAGDGYEVTVNGTVYNETNPVGTQIISGGAANSCDSTVTINLYYNSSGVNDINQILCPGGSVTANGTVYDEGNPTGTETITNGASNGCDSIINVNLSFYSSTTGFETYTGCIGDGYSVTVNGTVYNESNASGSEVLTDSNGCDSTVTITLFYNFPTMGNVLYSGCSGDGYSITVNGTLYDEFNPFGTEVISNGNANGCDSTVFVGLVFNSPSINDITQSLCTGNSITVNGTVYDEGNPSGTETIVNGAANGCDSVITIDLTFTPNATNTIDENRCEGDGFSVTVNGTVYNETNTNGAETIVGGSYLGCDSIVTVNLAFYPESTGSENYTGCTGDGYSVTVNGTTYNEGNPTGTEIIIGGNANGCDSTVTITLVFNADAINNLNQTLCTGSILTVNGTVYDEGNPSGTETIANAAANGCDSIINVNLTFNSFATNLFEENRCEGDGFSVMVNGTIYNEGNPTGTETITGGSYLGCDSVITVNLIFAPETTGSETYSGCESDGYSVMVNGTLYNEANANGTEVLTNVAGCDSTVTISLVFNAPTSGSETYTGCTGDGYSVTVNGTVYNEGNPTGTETITGGNVNGCDSTVTVTLMYNTDAVNNLNQTLCTGSSLTVNGTVYDEGNPSGTETIPNAAANGCDSIINVSLTFTSFASNEINENRCEGDGYSITVNGTVYNEANPTGSETITGGSYLGCDSVISVILVFAPESMGMESYMGCTEDGYLVMVNGTQYDEANSTGMEVLTNAAGCDSTVTINLVFEPNATSSFDVTICDGESYMFNSQSLTASGVYLDTLPAANTCDSIVTLNLTVQAPTQVMLADSICTGETYLFAGQTLTMPGTYYDTLYYTTGCDSVTTSLVLTEKFSCGQVFDLALEKNLAPGQTNIVEIGDTVIFNVKITNEGDFMAYNVLVIDYEPVGLDFDAPLSPGWTNFGAGPTWFYFGPLAPGASDSLNITMIVNSDATAANIENVAEISAADDDTNGGNTPPTDDDSTPNAFQYDDPESEDDHDGENLTLIQPILSLGNLVFADEDNDGVFNNDDYGIEDIEVVLYNVGPDGQKGTADDSPLDSMLTNGFGEYLFTGLVEDLYYVKLTGEGMPADFVSSTGDGIYDNDGMGPFEPSTGTDNNVDNEDDGSQMGVMVMSDTIRLTIGNEPGINQNLTVDFGLYNPQPLPTLDLGNLVFHDVDNDGTFNSGDSGIEDVEVVLFDVGPDGQKGTADDLPLDSMLTNGFGEYFFSGLAEGLYYVKLSGEGVPSGYVSSTGEGPFDLDGTGPYEPFSGTDNDVDNDDDGSQMGAMVMSDTIRLTIGGEPGDTINLTVDFGLYSPQELLSLGNLVFEDVDNDGVFNGDDTGIEDVEVVLFDLGPDGLKATADDVALDTIITNGFGEYIFSDLMEGLYYVKLSGEGVPANYVSSTGEGIYDNDGAGPFEPFMGTDNNVDDEDDGSQMGAMVMSDTIRLTFNSEPDGNVNYTVDFGLFQPDTFDLALIKVLALGQSGAVMPGDTVGFMVAVFNQGTVNAYGIEVRDSFPVNLNFDMGLNPGWSLNGDGTVSTTIAGPLPPGFPELLNIFGVVSGTANDGDLLQNEAEIATADDDTNSGNGTPDDIDSTPNEDMTDDIFGGDDVTDNTGNDEDDHDIEIVEVNVLPTLSLGNLVFADEDNDGQYNNADYGLEDIEVILFDVGPDGQKNTADDIALDSILTNGFGEYLFSGLAEGLYYVKLSGEGVPTDYISSTGDGIYDNDGAGPFEPSTGTDNNVDDEDDGSQMGAMVMSDTIRLNLDDEPDGNVNLTVDFGLYAPQPLPTLSLGNLVFHDEDNDGVFNNDDNGLEDIEAVLFDVGPDGQKNTADDIALDSMLTNGFGEYLFTDLAEGLYYVKLSGEGVPTDYVSSTGEGPHDLDGAGPYEPISGTDNNVDGEDDGSQMGAMVMSDTIRLTLFGEPDGNVNTTVDFGLYAPQELLSLGNLVFHDVENDGLFNGDDTGLEDVEVVLFDVGPDGQKGTADDVALDSMMTDGIGEYLFTDLAEGLYYVKLSGEGVPTNYVSSTGDGPFDNDGSGAYEPSAGTDNNVDNEDDGSQMGAMVMSDTIRLTFNAEPAGGGNFNPTVDFGLFEPIEYASLGDLVWYDNDHDGQQGLDEPGVPDVIAQLFDLGDDGVKGGGDDVLIESDTTNVDGIYGFENLEPGDYYVMFDLGTLPTNFNPTTQDSGNDATDSDANAMGMTDVVTLSSGEDDPTIDMGIEPELASLGNFVWLDDNKNGQQDGGEAGVPDVTVQLFDLGDDGVKGGGDDNLIDTDMTDGTGEYGFTNLEPGDYYVMFDLTTIPTGYLPTQMDNGNDATDSDANIMGMTNVVTLGAGENDTTIDMGIEPEETGLGDLVWFDLDHDGQQDLDEPGVPDVTVQLFDLGDDGVKGGGDDNLIDTDMTDANGIYGFEGLDPGDYYVMFDLGTLPTNYNPTSQDTGNDMTDSDANSMGMTDIVTLVPGVFNPSIDMGIEPELASLGDFVWFDENENGQQNGGENGVPNVTVQLFDLGDDGVKGGGDDNLIDTDMTDGGGAYGFANLEPGDYYVMFDLGTLPTNYNPTTQDSGNDATDSDANSMGMTDVVTLSAGEDDPTIDMGITPEPANLGDLVWYDLDHDGQQDADESGVPDVTVQLFDLGDDGVKGSSDDNLIDTDTTDGAGQYGFTGLEPSDYYVMFDLSTLPTNYNPTTQDNGNDATDSDANTMGMTNVVTLGAGEDNPTIDMGIEPELASLGDFVWFDDNKNGQQNGGENGVPDVTVQLFDLGDDGVKGGGDDNLIDTDETDNDGLYGFENLEPGDYYVMFDLSTLPTGYQTSTQDNGNDTSDSDANPMGMTDVISLGAGEDDPTIDMGINPIPAGIGNFVWFDENLNGQQDGAETGVPNVTVQLFDLGDDGVKGGGDDNLIDTDETDNDGIYGFENLEPDDYYVMFDLTTTPTDYVVTATNSGNDATDSDANGMGMTDVITLAAGEANPTIDMGIYDPMFDLALFKNLSPGQPSQVDIGDDVAYMIRVENEGLISAYEILISDHIPTGMVLSPNDALWIPENDSTATYTLAGPLAPGEADSVEIILTVLYGASNSSLVNVAEIDSAEDQNGVTVNDIDSTPDNDVAGEDDIDDEPITLLEHDPTGFIYCEKTGQVITGGTISVTGPNGIPNDEVAIVLDGSTGYYEFYAVGTPGIYTLTYSHPSGMPMSTICTAEAGAFDPTGPNDHFFGSDASNGYLIDTACASNPFYLEFDLALGDPNIYFNNLPVQCVFIGSFVCEDTDLNDQADGTEPMMPGVTVNLYDCADTINTIATTVTDANGRYRFDGLLAGDYRVQFVAPNGYRQIQGVALSPTGFADCVTLDFGDCDTTTSTCMIPCATVDAGNDVTICFGDSTQLSASPNYGTGIFTWTPSAGLNNAFIADPEANPVSSTDYIVTYDDGLGCTDIDTVRVNVASTNPMQTNSPFVSQTIECTEPIPFEAPIFGDACDANLTITLDSTVTALSCGYMIERTWTATNNEGNSTSFTQSVTVEDNTPPMVTATHPVIGSLSNGGVYNVDCSRLSSFDSMVINAVDDCSLVTTDFAETTTPADCATDGYIQSMYCGWTAVDTCGNMDSLFFTVFIIDNTPPELIGIPADVAASCGSVPVAPTVTATDICDSDVSVTMSEMTTTDPSGCSSALVRTWTATDDCGNTASASQTISLSDNEAPVLTINHPMLAGVMDGDTMYMECQDLVSLSADDASATDNCCGVTIDFQEFVTAANCADDGYVQFMTCGYVATDCCGNTDSFFFHVFVLDNTAPALFNVPADLSLECSNIPPTPPTVYAVDNCANNLMVDFEETVSGDTITRTWTSADNCGNVGSETQLIILQATAVAPVISNVPNDTIVSCEDGLPAIPIDVIATDDCDPNPMLTFSETDLNDCGGSVTRNWVAIDADGNVTMASQTITMEDNEAPVITGVGPDEVYQCTPGIISTTITVTDNCTPNPMVTLESDTTNLACGYEIEYTYTATDDCGNQTMVSRTITVNDTEDPVLVGVPADLTMSCELPVPPAANVTASDNCGVGPVQFAEVSNGNCPEVITRTWTVSDQCGNTVSASQTITIEDNEAPMMMANHPFFGAIEHGDTLYADCTQIASLDSLGFADSDNCSVPVRTFDEIVTPGDCATDGYVELRHCGWTSTDACGNSDSLFFVVIISDNMAPTILGGVPADVTVSCDNLPSANANIMAMDTCDDSLEVSSNDVIIPGACDGNYTIERTWSVTDDCGNEVTAIQTITVEDVGEPNLIGVPADVTVTCGNIPDTAAVTTDDICGSATITVEDVVGTGCPFTIERTWTATDDCGNEISATQIITVDDTDAPMLIGTPADITLSCGDIPPTANVTADDGCDSEVPVNFEETINGGDCPFTITRIWTATDDCGNVASYTQTITVNDDEVPVFTEPIDLVVTCGNVPPLDTPFVSDNCDTSLIINLVELIEDMGCGQEIKRTWTATDDCGNVATVDQIITVTDDLAPQISFNHPLLIGLTDGDVVTMECDSATIFGATDADATDDCSAVDIEFVETGVTQGDCAIDGFIVTMNCSWIATDACGNADTVTLTMQIVDSNAPTFDNVPADVTVDCGDVIPVFGTPIASDACGDVILTFDSVTVVTTDGYDLVGTWTATDDCGNEMTASQTIHVIENGTPMLVGVPNDTLIIISDGEVEPPIANVTAEDCFGNNFGVEFIRELTVSPDGCDTTFINTWTVEGTMISASQTVEVINEDCPCVLPELDTLVTTPDLCDDDTGTAAVTLIQDEADYTWTWTPDIGTPNAIGNERTDLPSGIYSVTAENLNCTLTIDLTIEAECDCELAVIDSVSTTTASCGVSDASATINLGNDANDYEYLWVPDLGTPAGAGNERTDLPSAHYVVFITYQGNTDCVKKVEFDIFDDCPRCPPMTNEVAIYREVEETPTEVCVPIPFGVAFDLDIELNGDTYTNGVQGCDLQNVIAYDYSTAYDAAQNGQFYVLWQHDGEVFSTVVENMNQLAAGMDFVDPIGEWRNDAKSFRLISTNLTGDYNGLTLHHIATETVTYHGPANDEAFMGAKLILPIGENELMFTPNEPDCSVELLAHVVLLEQIFEDESATVTGDCDLGALTFCLGISELEIDEYEIYVDGTLYTDVMDGCEWETTQYYSYGFLQSLGAPPYEVESWTFNGTTYSSGFTFETFEELVEQMNDWDVDGNWEIDEALNSIKTINSTNDYGGLKIKHLATATSIEMFVNTQSVATSLSIELTEGDHEVTAKRIIDGYTDTIFVTAECQTTTAVEEADELKGLVIFNGFSPNGDGSNDHFRIDGLGQYPDHELTIYSQIGTRVFQARSYRSDWGGAWGPNDLPNGTYFYILTDGNGNRRTGYVQVKR